MLQRRALRGFLYSLVLFVFIATIVTLPYNLLFALPWMAPVFVDAAFSQWPWVKYLLPVAGIFVFTLSNFFFLRRQKDLNTQFGMQLGYACALLFLFLPQQMESMVDTALQPTENYQLYQQAIDSNDPSMCDTLSTDVSQHFNQSSCLTEVARATKDAAICERIIHGSKDECYSAALLAQNDFRSCLYDTRVSTTTCQQIIVRRMISTGDFTSLPIREPIDSRYCTADPEELAIGNDRYPVASEYEHLDWLGSLFTGYRCGEERFSAVYESQRPYGITVIPNGQGKSFFVDILPELGFVCVDQLPSGFCLAWDAQNLPKEKIILLLPFLEYIAADTCSSCG